MKHATTAGQPRGQIIDGISIRHRPAEVEDRAIPGHWEGDLISGSQNTHLATMVERQSRFIMLVKVPGKDTVSMVTALSQPVRRLPSALRRSLTWDRGMELAQHKPFTVDTNVQVRDSAGPMKIRIACCDSVFRKSSTSAAEDLGISDASRYARLDAGVALTG